MREHAHDIPNPKEPLLIASAQEAPPPEDVPEQLLKPQNTPSASLNDFGAMPSPIRYFSYFFFISSFLLLVAGILYQWLK